MKRTSCASPPRSPVCRTPRVPPCVRHSDWNTTLERRVSGAAVRVGLSRVFGLHRATAERIVAARHDHAFESLADLIERVRPCLPELEALALAGSLDVLRRTRP